MKNKKILFAVIAIVLVAAIGIGLWVALPKYDLSEIPEDIQVIEMKGDELKILNLTDIQMTSAEWNAKGDAYEIGTGTITKLIEKEQPDLITITGDNSYTNVIQYDAYEQLAAFLDSFKIPWAPVWGNHDNEGGDEAVEEIEKIFAKSEYTLFKEGPEELGSGNYTVFVSNGKKIVEGLIFMDTHEASYRENILGDMVIDSYDKLSEEQLEWYKEQVAISKEFGCKDTSIFIHIPIYAYRDAYNAADGNVEDDYDIPRDKSDSDEYWNEGYEDSFGLRNDGWGHPKEDDGVLQVLIDSQSTKHVFCGHDHKNNYSIEYEGVRLTYCTKTGAGCYWQSNINGGTVITVDKNGVSDIRHVYIDDYLDREVYYLGNDPIYGGVA